MDKIIAANRRKLKRELELANRMLKFWKTEYSIDRSLKNSELPSIVKHVAIALFIKACRQFESVVRLIEKCEASDAVAVSRCMYETWLTMAFVLSRTLPRFAKQHRDLQANDKKRPFNREFRAFLYSVHVVLDDDRYWDNVSKFRQFKTLAANARAAKANFAHLDKAKYFIGSGWLRRLERSKSYSGLRIVELAEMIGPSAIMLYRSFYGHSSGVVHAADAMDYIDIRDGKLFGRWHSRTRTARGNIQIASMLFIAIMQEFCEHLHSSEGKKMLMRVFMADLKSITAISHSDDLGE